MPPDFGRRRFSPSLPVFLVLVLLVLPLALVTLLVVLLASLLALGGA